jgi:hypothetical protein
VNFKLDDFELIDDLLYHLYRMKNGDAIRQLAIPSELRKEYLTHIHTGLGSGGHLGINKSYDKLLNRFWWPNAYRDLENWIKTCDRCQARKSPRQTAALQPNIFTFRPFECVGVDVLGPLPLSSRGYRYIIVFIDHFTRWVEAFPMRKNDAETCARLLVEQIVCRYGAPQKLLSDRGSPFLSSLAYKVYKLMNIHKLNTTAYHPQTNGMVERFNSTLVAMLAMYVSIDQKDWDRYIPYCVFAYNTSRHEMNRFTPFFLLFGRQATLPVDVFCRVDNAPYLSMNEYAQDIIRKMRIAHSLARRNQREINNAIHTKALAKPPPQFRPGDLVMMHFFPRKAGLTPKLSLLWRGPFEVVEKLAPVTYRIRVPGINSQLSYVTHVNRLKRFYQTTDVFRQKEQIAEMEEREQLIQEEIRRQHRQKIEQTAADEMEQENKD